MDPVRAAAFGTLCLFLVAVAIAGAWGVFSSAFPGPRTGAAAAPSMILDVETVSLSPEVLRPLSAEEAIAVNHSRPEANMALPAPSPFVIGPENLLNRLKAIDCLTAAIYYEAANEPYEGQTAVAQVVLNRVRLPHYPHSICGVVFQGSERRTGCQFSFTCDGSLRRPPSAEGWRRARAISEAALSGQVNAKVGWATHYHADYVAPYWAPRLVKLRTIGRHIFYGWPGIWDRSSAFAQVYAGGEQGLVQTPGDAPPPAPLPVDPAAPVTIARVVPMNERPVLSAAAASPAGAKGATVARWVLGSPPKIAEQDAAAPPAS